MNLDNWPYKQHELLKTAMEATDAYLAVEKSAKTTGIVTNNMIHDFSYHMSRAHDALQTLGVLDQHQGYMDYHVQEMMKLHGHKDEKIFDQPYVHVPKADYGEVEEEAQVWDKPSPVKNSKKLSPEQKAKAKARAKAAGRPYPNMIDNMYAARQESKVVSFSSFIDEEKKSSENNTINDEEIDKIVDGLEWEDIVDLYDEDDLIYDEDQEDLHEKISVQGRLRKKQAMLRNKSRRNMARNLKLRRVSSVEVLKKRAVLAARRAVYKRLLRGRDKSTLSAAEKDRIEQQVARMKFMQAAIATKMLPKMRSIEQKRLKGYRQPKK